MIVHRDHADRRNPQDFVRARHDRQRVPEPRPEYTSAGMAIDMEAITIDSPDFPIDQQGDVFLDTNQVTADDL